VVTDTAKEIGEPLPEAIEQAVAWCARVAEADKAAKPSKRIQEFLFRGKKRKKAEVESLTSGAESLTSGGASQGICDDASDEEAPLQRGGKIKGVTPNNKAATSTLEVENRNLKEQLAKQAELILQLQKAVEELTARSSPEIPPPGKIKTTYATVADRGQQRRQQEAKKPLTNKSLSRLAERSIQARKEPKEFVKIQAKLNDTRPMKKARGRDKYRLIWGIVKRLGIRSHVIEVSKIGNSVIEIYVLAEAADTVRTAITNTEMELVVVDPLVNRGELRKSQKAAESATYRLANLLSRTRLVKLRECILKGLPVAFQQEVLLEAQRIKEEKELAAQPKRAAAQEKGKKGVVSTMQMDETSDGQNNL
jgi:hypothetical protein